MNIYAVNSFPGDLFWKQNKTYINYIYKILLYKQDLPQLIMVKYFYRLNFWIFLSSILQCCEDSV